MAKPICTVSYNHPINAATLQSELYLLTTTHHLHRFYITASARPTVFPIRFAQTYPFQVTDSCEASGREKEYRDIRPWIVLLNDIRTWFIRCARVEVNIPYAAIIIPYASITIISHTYLPTYPTSPPPCPFPPKTPASLTKNPQPYHTIPSPPPPKVLPTPLGFLRILATVQRCEGQSD